MVAGCVPGVKGKFDWEQEVTQQHSVFNSGQRGCEGPELGGGVCLGGGAQSPQGRSAHFWLLFRFFFFCFIAVKMGVPLGRGVRCRVFEERGQGVREPLGAWGVNLLPRRSGSKLWPEVSPRAVPTPSFRVISGEAVGLARFSSFGGRVGAEQVGVESSVVGREGVEGGSAGSSRVTLSCRAGKERGQGVGAR